jgi:hypothetical protein
MTVPFDNAFTMLSAILQQWGLSSLNSVVRDMLTAGDSQDVIPLKLRETEQYKKRFAGNDQRMKAGLPVLSEAEYLSTESAMREVVSRNLGSGTYDTSENLTKWIGSNVSPQALQDRVTAYRKNYMQQPQWVKEAWAQKGFTPAQAIQVMIDPSVSEAHLTRQLGTFALGSEALQAYRDTYDFNTDRLSQLSDAGVTADEARKGFQDIAARDQYEGFLARTTGVDLTRTDQENAELLSDAQAAAKRRKVLNTDQARFQENYLGGLNSMTKPATGSY